MPDTKLIKLETDYLVVGCGAMSIAFVDEILHSRSKAEIILVDKHAKPGGHWNDAYQFVTLHQPAAYYGVNSKQLGEGGEDLVSKSQILAYYELVMKDFLATNRVNFFLCVNILAIIALNQWWTMMSSTKSQFVRRQSMERT